jgi:hypothetical protein
MRYEDFWYNYDLREFSNAVDGYLEKEEKSDRESWEQTRLIYAAIMNKPVWGYRINPKKPQSLLPLPWDNKDLGGKNSKVDQDLLNELRRETWGQQP